MELPQIAFLKEESASALQSLQARLPQRPLPTEVVRRLRQELRLPALAHQFLNVVETCAALLAATGGELQAFGTEAQEMLLTDYLGKVLLSKERLPSETAASEVRLCHLAATASMLEELTAEDQFALVSARYKCALEPSQQAALQIAAAHMELGVLLPAWRSFVLSRLREEYLNAAESLKTTLGFVESENGDLGHLPWFAASFPDDLRLAHAAAGLRLLTADMAPA